MKKQILIILTSLAAQSSFAQNTTNEIFETQDYIQGLINQIDHQPTSRFQVSGDYAEAGTALQNEMKARYQEFKATMESILHGPFADSISQYNRYIKDEGSYAKSDRKKALLLSIQNQIPIFEHIYSSAIDQLYRLEPRWYKRAQSSVRNGWTDHYGLPFSRDYSKMLVRTIRRQCDTRICFLNLFSDLSTYYTNVETLIAKNLVISLADGTPVIIHANIPEGARFIVNKLRGLQGKVSDAARKYKN